MTIIHRGGGRGEGGDGGESERRERGRERKGRTTVAFSLYDLSQFSVSALECEVYWSLSSFVLQIYRCSHSLVFVQQVHNYTFMALIIISSLKPPSLHLPSTLLTYYTCPHAACSGVSPNASCQSTFAPASTNSNTVLACPQ